MFRPADPASPVVGGSATSLTHSHSALVRVLAASFGEPLAIVE